MRKFVSSTPDEMPCERLPEGGRTDVPKNFRPAGRDFGTMNSSSGCILDQLIDASVPQVCENVG